MPLAPQVPNTPEDVTKYATITSRAATGTQVRYFIDADPGFVAGDVVAISGFASDPSSNAYNGTYTIVSVGSNPPSFLVNSTANGPITLTTDYPQVVSLGSSGSEDYDYTDVNPVYLIDSEDLVDNNSIYSATQPVGKFDGQLWFDTSNGNKLYRYNATTGQWVSVQDAAIASASAAASAASAAAAAAAAAATAAQTTADGKNRIYRQASQPSSGVEGDLWFDSDDDNKMYRYTSGSWAVAVQLGNNAIASLSASKLTAGTIDASVINVSNINAGNISSGFLAAARIATASLDASVLNAGTINSNVVYAGTINASQISTGTLNASVVYSGNINASQITAGTISAARIGAGTITTDKLVAGTLSGFTIQSTNAAFTISSTGSISGADTIGCNSLTASGTVAGTTLSATGAMSANSITITSTASFNGASNSFPNITQSTSAANLRWGTTTGGRIFESTASSARFKTDIVDLTSVPDLDPKQLLSLPVRAFRYRDDYLGEEDERSGVLVPGFIAEEVDQHYPIAADYEQGQPNNWNDKFLVPAMLSLIQDLYAQIAELKENA